jgi:DNA-binding transcriptional regulator YiaG
MFIQICDHHILYLRSYVVQNALLSVTRDIPPPCNHLAVCTGHLPILEYYSCLICLCGTEFDSQVAHMEYKFTQTYSFKTFAQMMVFLRGQRGMSQKHLAEALNSKQSVIARWENSLIPPSLASQLKIARTLGLVMNEPMFVCKKCKETLRKCKCK